MRLDRDEVLQFFKEDHEKLVKVIDQLDETLMVNQSILVDWDVKDIISHISAWNREIVKAVEVVLTNGRPWYAGAQPGGGQEAEFNREEIKRRRSWPLRQVLEEWQDSYDALIKRIEHLTDSDWQHQTEFTWPDGSPVSIPSLFGYRYKGEGHEGGHARQIKVHFDLYR